MTEAGTLTETFPVRSYELGPEGYASMATICNYLQEAAGSHARVLGVGMDEMSAQGLTWVLARLHVRVEAYPAWQDRVTVHTWPSGTDGLYATREFVLYDGSGTRLGQASSAWLVIDRERRRPVRLPGFILGIDLPDRPRPIEDPFPRFTLPPSDPVSSRPFVVRYSDLDLNQHVNNVCYVAWALEAVPEDVRRAYRPSSVEIQFRAETTLGMQILSEVLPLPGEAGPAFGHRLSRTGDGREVAVVRSRWVAA
jgi:acyl-ACP thioesterase